MPRNSGISAVPFDHIGNGLYALAMLTKNDHLYARGIRPAYFPPESALVLRIGEVSRKLVKILLAVYNELFIPLDLIVCNVHFPDIVVNAVFVKIPQDMGVFLLSAVPDYNFRHRP